MFSNLFIPHLASKTYINLPYNKHFIFHFQLVTKPSPPHGLAPAAQTLFFHPPCR